MTRRRRWTRWSSCGQPTTHRASARPSYFHLRASAGRSCSVAVTAAMVGTSERVSCASGRATRSRCRRLRRLTCRVRSSSRAATPTAGSRCKTWGSGHWSWQARRSTRGARARGTSSRLVVRWCCSACDGRRRFSRCERPPGSSTSRSAPPTGSGTSASRRTPGPRPTTCTSRARAAHRTCPHPRREWHRQGAHRPGDPCARSACGASLRRAQCGDRPFRNHRRGALWVRRELSERRHAGAARVGR